MARLKAHGLAVGLPSDEDMGNSEVGHNALGAGRVFAQGAKLVNAAIASGAIFRGAAWRSVTERAASGGTVHLIGLLSDGNVHSHINHLFAMLDRLAADLVGRVRVHVLADGRDVGERSVLGYLEPLEDCLLAFRNRGLDYCVASGGGRMVTTMDRYNANWAVVEKGWKAHVLGEGRPFESAKEAVETYYREDPIHHRPVPRQLRHRQGRAAGRDHRGRRRRRVLQLQRRPRHRDLAGRSRRPTSPRSIESGSPRSSTPA